MTRRYFTEQDARGRMGLRVQPRVAIIRVGLSASKTRLIISSGARGTVTQLASGPYPDSCLVGVAWDDRCRNNRYPIDWYTEDEYRDLLEAEVEDRRVPIEELVFRDLSKYVRNDDSGNLAQFYAASEEEDA